MRALEWDGTSADRLTLMFDWWLDEKRVAGDEHLDDEFVASYEAKAHFDPSHDVQLLVDNGLTHRSTIVDFGAGTGTFACAVAQTGAEVFAVDPSPAMVKAARSKTALLPNLTVVQAGLLSYEHHGDPIGFVYSRNALHHLPEFWKVIALLRIADLLERDGILLLRDIAFDFAPSETTASLNAWLKAAPSDAATGYTRNDMAKHVREEFSTFSWLLEESLRNTGFEIIEKTVDRNVYAKYLCRR